MTTRVDARFAGLPPLFGRELSDLYKSDYKRSRIMHGGVGVSVHELDIPMFVLTQSIELPNYLLVDFRGLVHGWMDGWKE